jgi:hypothetical protein
LSSKSPEQELDEFLRTAPSCLRDMFRFESMSPKEQAEWRSAFYWWRLVSSWQDRREFEELLKSLRPRWREYCKRVRELARLGLPSARPGRQREDALAEEAEQLERAGLSQSKIARELNRRHPNRKDSKGNPKPLTPDAVRKKLTSRRGTTPDKS